MRRRLNSLKARVAGFVFVASCASVWLLTLASSVHLETEVVDALEQEQCAVASYLAGEIDIKLKQRLALMRQNSSLIAGRIGSPTQASAFLETRIGLQALFPGGLAVFDASGRRIAEMAGPDGRGALDWQRIAAAQSGRDVITVLAPADTPGEATLAVAVPIRDRAGQPRGVLSGLVPLSGAGVLGTLTSALSGRGRTLLVSEQRSARIIAASDARLLHQPRSAAIVDEPDDSGRASDSGKTNGEDTAKACRTQLNAAGKVVSTVDVPLPQWRVDVAIPEITAFAPIRRVQRETYALAAAVSFVLLLGTAAFVTRVLNPLAQLADAMRRMTASGGDLQTLPAARLGEIQSLVDSFNALVERRRQAEAALLRSESRLAQAELVSKTGHWELQLDSMTIAASAGAVQIYGAAHATDYFPAIQKATLPEYRERLDRAFDGLVHRDEAYDESFRVHALDTGQIKDLRVIATLDRASGVVFGVVQDISERLAFERALKHAEARHRLFFAQTAEGIAVLAHDGRLLEWNPAFAGMLGYEADELAALSVFDWEAGITRAEVTRLLASQFDNRTIETLHRRKDGTLYAAEVSIARVAWSGDEYSYCLCRDISARKRAEEAQRLAATVFSYAKEAIMVTDARGTILDVNPTFSEIAGYTRDEVVGQNPRLLRSGRHDAAFYAHLWNALGANGHWSGEIWNRRKDGTVFPEMLVINSVRDEHGAVQQYVALFSDITERKDQQLKLERMAHYDALTGLPNRSLLADRLGRAMRLAARQGRRIVVCYLDLDGFKEINDRHGHALGDRLLKVLAERMQSTLRDSDTLARIGGDEFVAVLLDQEKGVTSYASIERLIAEVARPADLDGTEVCVTVSLGMTAYPQAQTVDADQLLRQADQAMYRAKQSGKNRYCVFDDLPPTPRAQ